MLTFSLLPRLSIDQHAKHAERLVVINKTHTPQVRRQIVNSIRIFQCPLAVFQFLQVHLQILHVGKR